MSEWYVLAFVVVVVVIVGVVGYKQGWFDKKSKCKCGEEECPKCGYCVPKSSVITHPAMTKNPFLSHRILRFEKCHSIAMDIGKNVEKTKLQVFQNRDLVLTAPYQITT